MPQKNLQIRNSTAEFLIFTKQAGENGIEVRVQDGTIWLSQKLMAALFDCTTENIIMHLKNIFADGELNDVSVTKDFLVTAAEVIYERADAAKKHMGLTTWGKSPHGKIVKTDVTIAKNYLTEAELESLGRIVNAYLDLAEDRAKKHIPMTMEDWAKRLDRFLEADDRSVLQDSGKISAQIAKEFAENEFEKYRIIQDHLFESDFDKEVKKIRRRKPAGL